MRPTALIVPLLACIALAACSKPAPAPDAVPATDASAASQPAPPAPAAVEPAPAPVATAESAPPPLHIVYDCGGTPVDATFDGDTASVTIDGNTYAMQTVRSGSGARYSDPKGNVFWTKGMSETQWIPAGQAETACTAKPA